MPVLKSRLLGVYVYPQIEWLTDMYLWIIVDNQGRGVDNCGDNSLNCG